MAAQWTPADDERLRTLYADATTPITRIAVALGRTRQAVVKHANEIGLRRPTDAPRLEDEFGGA